MPPLIAATAAVAPDTRVEAAREDAARYPQDYAAWVTLAHLTPDPAEALAAWERAAAISGGNAETALGLAEARLAAGDVRGARAAADDAVARLPESAVAGRLALLAAATPTGWEAPAWRAMAARRYTVAATASETDPAWVACALGWQQLRMGDVAGARSLFSSVLPSDLPSTLPHDRRDLSPAQACAAAGLDALPAPTRAAVGLWADTDLDARWTGTLWGGLTLHDRWSVEALGRGTTFTFSDDSQTVLVPAPPPAERGTFVEDPVWVEGSGQSLQAFGRVGHARALQGIPAGALLWGGVTTDTTDTTITTPTVTSGRDEPPVVTDVVTEESTSVDALLLGGQLWAAPGATIRLGGMWGRDDTITHWQASVSAEVPLTRRWSVGAGYQATAVSEDDAVHHQGSAALALHTAPATVRVGGRLGTEVYPVREDTLTPWQLSRPLGASALADADIPLYGPLHLDLHYAYIQLPSTETDEADTMHDLTAGLVFTPGGSKTR